MRLHLSEAPSPSQDRTAGVWLHIFKETPLCRAPLASALTYWGMRMIPCESCPARLASTKLRATMSASPVRHAGGLEEITGENDETFGGESRHGASILQGA